MARDSRTFTQQVRERFAAGHALSYIADVIDNTLPEGEKVDQVRLESCWRAIHKLVPNPPTGTYEIPEDQIPDFAIIHEQD